MQRPIPPPVPPALPPRLEQAVRPHHGGVDVGPVVVVTTKRRAKRRGGGGAAAAMSLLLAVSAVAGGFLAWPYLQKPRRGTKKASITATAPVTVAMAVAPRGTNSDGVAGEQRAVSDRERGTRDAEQKVGQRKPKSADQQARIEQEQVATPAQVSTEQQEAGNRGPAVADEVDRRISEAATAFRGRDYESGTKALDQADAGDDADLATRVERWRLLLDYARQLDGHVGKAIAAANKGREYTIGDRAIVIIEIGPDGYAYKESGVIQRGPRANLPRVVERAILKAWYDGDPRPANGIFVGVHHLLDDDADLEKVRAAWEQALVGEPATASIMPLLDDPALAAGL